VKEKKKGSEGKQRRKEVKEGSGLKEKKEGSEVKKKEGSEAKKKGRK
jgi:hypothetical protein